MENEDTAMQRSVPLNGYACSFFWCRFWPFLDHSSDGRHHLCSSKPLNYTVSLLTKYFTRVKDGPYVVKPSSSPTVVRFQSVLPRIL